MRMSMFGLILAAGALLSGCGYNAIQSQDEQITFMKSWQARHAQ